MHTNAHMIKIIIIFLKKYEKFKLGLKFILVTLSIMQNEVIILEKDFKIKISIWIFYIASFSICSGYLYYNYIYYFFFLFRLLSFM